MTDVNLDSVFLTSVQTAVGTSVGQNKPLVVYIAASDSDASWINALVSQQTLQLIREKAVGLQLVKGSNECLMFEQVFPNAQAPSVFIIRVQAVLDVIYGEVTKEEFEERVKKVIDVEQPPLPTPSPVPEQQAVPQQPNLQHAEQPTLSPSPVITAAPAASLSHTPRATPPRATSAQPRSLKQQSADLKAKQYREEQLRLKQTKREERERIRRLLKADEDERRALERERRLSKATHDDINDEEGDAAIKAFRDSVKPRSAGTTCALALRLLDGYSIQHEFSATDTLSTVRKWLDANRTDGSVPYCFHRTIPRTTYEASDEEKTLVDLELTPRSALILKPFNSYTEAYSRGSTAQGGLLSRVWGGLSSFWGGAPHDQGHNPAQGSSMGSTSSSSEPPAYEPYRDDPANLPPQSPQSSYYASPMHSPDPTTFAFELAHPSALNLNLNVTENESYPVRARTPQVNEAAVPPASLSRMSSNIRTLDSPRTDLDDRNTYNGNRLTLEDDNKNKKAKK